MNISFGNNDEKYNKMGSEGLLNNYKESNEKKSNEARISDIKFLDFSKF